MEETINRKQLLLEWENNCRTFLKGKTIKTVRYLTDKEQRELDWSGKSLLIIFTDGTYIFPACDDEGNDAGALFTSDENLPVIPVF